MNLYHVVTDKTSVEAAALSKVKPDNLLGSYFYFRTKSLKDYFEKLGYTPKNFMLDSGAFSAWTTGKNISIIDYMDYIKVNKDYIQHYIALDVFGDAELTFDYFNIMIKKGFNPIPVFHYGADIKYLESYINQGCNYIALGATVPITDKAIVAKWVNKLQYLYPKIKFHLLGSSSQEITLNTDVYSSDSSTWIMQAINGKPKYITGKTKEAKIERAIENLIHINTRSQSRQLRIC